MTEQQTLVEFLTARLDEDEAAALDAIKAREGGLPPEGNAIQRVIDASPGTASIEDVLYTVWCAALDAKAMMEEPHATEDGYLKYQRKKLHRAREAIALNDPARVLREVAAKRAILEQWEAYAKERTRLMNGWPNLDIPPYLAALAAVYSDHPDYRPEWSTM